MPAYRFGKNPPKNDYRTLRLKKYLTSRLAAPPPAYDALSRVYSKLKTSDAPKLFPMDGNDTIGDCAIAAVAHAITVYRGLIGKQKIMREQAIVKLYYHLTGGVDSGLYGLDVMNYWRQHSVSDDKILAFASVDWRNHTHIDKPCNFSAAFGLASRCNRIASSNLKPVNRGHRVH
jgi:hypothetical protein